MDTQEKKSLPRHLEGLNKEQLQAVHAQGPILVLAGAGAGKTKTITARIVELVSTGIRPESILAITFTNKAAQEMRERVRQALHEQKNLGLVTIGETPFVSTFHAFCVHVLRRFGESVGVPKNFNILDRADSQKMLRDVMGEIGLDPKQIEPSRILAHISREKGNLRSVEMLREQHEQGDFGNSLVARIWERYREQLGKERSLDFDDLLVKAVTLLREHSDVRSTIQEQWQHIHVDEYQDTNKAQYELVRLLVEPRKSIFVVGDIDQTIYTWRGAYIKNLINFEKDYPGTSLIVLEENYRSTKTILDAANMVIQKNTLRYEKNLRANKGVGEPLGIYAAYDEVDEASFVAHKAQELIAQGIDRGEIAVLYRANFQSRSLEQAFLELKVPYQVLGTKFFERKEIKDVLAFIRVARNPEGTSDFKRIINVPPRGIGKLTLLKILAGKEQELSPSLKKKLREFKELLSAIAGFSSSHKPSETVKFVFEKSGMKTGFGGKSEEDREKLENVKELVTVATAYDTLPYPEGIERLLEDATLRSDQDELAEKTSAVRLMTVHASKGLEFDYVFITGLEQDLFPHPRDTGEVSPEEAEEERRLFYVALTRARERVFLLYASVRTIFGSRTLSLPSEFLTDIDDRLLIQEAHPLHTLKTIRFD